MSTLEFSEQSQEQLRKLGRPVEKRICRKLKFYSAQPDFLKFAKPLKGSLHSLYRFRVGDYRIVFCVGDGKIMVRRIDHRSVVYED